MMKNFQAGWAAGIAGAILLIGGAAEAKKEPRQAWRVSRVADPITGASTCVVAAFDYFGKTAYSRAGYLYPIVESNSSLGVLVGVSSGGKFRFPTGDIVWRVDDRPFRELKAADNPVPDGSQPNRPVGASNAATKAMDDTMALTAKLIVTMTATSTVASGARAREMLAEMQAGQSLIFRASQAAPAYGLPSSETYRVGQITDEGLKPIPLDASFRAGLSECGISTAPE